jgi:hypothetical protein
MQLHRRQYQSTENQRGYVIQLIRRGVQILPGIYFFLSRIGLKIMRLIWGLDRTTPKKYRTGPNRRFNNFCMLRSDHALLCTYECVRRVIDMFASLETRRARRTGFSIILSRHECVAVSAVPIRIPLAVSEWKKITRV